MYLVMLLCLFLAPPNTDDINQLIRQLGSPEFAEREAATRRLQAIGEPAVEALRKATEGSDDPEVRHRARQLRAPLRARSASSEASQSI